MDGTEKDTDGRHGMDSIHPFADSHVARLFFHNSFATAFWTLLLGLGLPSAVVFFGSIRASEHGISPNPRWARYASFSKARDFAEEKPASQNSIVIGGTETCIAGRAADQPAAANVKHLSTIETSLTGSISGRRSIEIAARKQVSDSNTTESTHSRSKRDQYQNQPETMDDEVCDTSARSNDRIQTKVEQVQKKNDKLTERQSGPHSEDAVQQTQIVETQNQLLKNDAELLNAVKELSQLVNGAPAKAVGDKQKRWSPTIATSSKSPSARLVPEKCASTSQEPRSQETVIAEKLDNVTSNSNEIDEKSIHIRRESGREMIDVFTMDIIDADIRQFLTRLSEVAKVGILPSPGVQGRISLHLRKVRLEPALKAIVKSRDCVVERESGILVIRTAAEATGMKF